MKKTIATSLLIILIFSCVFSFVACTNSTDPVVGYYKSTTQDDSREWYLKVNEDNTAIMFVVKKDTHSIVKQYEYSWSYNQTTKEYRFIDRSPGSSGSVTSYVLRNPNNGDTLNGLASDFETDKLRYERYYDTDWLM